MKPLQVLVATMHQQDFSIAEQMNIRCNAIIANQSDRNETIEKNGLTMITTDTRGVGVNRNIALQAADAQIIVFADDDVVYYDDMPQAVTAAFQENPKADVLVFGIDITRNGKVTERRHLRNKRLHVWNAMRFGTVRVAARRNALCDANITFNEHFGGGCPFSSGEDSLFLKACFDAGLKVYAHEYVLGTCAKDVSTWFQGYNEKYFYDKGVLMRHLFPKSPRLMALYFGIRFKRHTELGVLRRVQLMIAGVNAGKNLTPYRDGI